VPAAVYRVTTSPPSHTAHDAVKAGFFGVPAVVLVPGAVAHERVPPYRTAAAKITAVSCGVVGGVVEVVTLMMTVTVVPATTTSTRVVL